MGYRGLEKKGFGKEGAFFFFFLLRNWPYGSCDGGRVGLGGEAACLKEKVQGAGRRNERYNEGSR